MSPEKEGRQDRQFFATLPPVADLDQTSRQRVVELLELLDQITAKQAELEAADEAAKKELEKLQYDTGKDGFRYGLLCYAAQTVKGRKSLDKFALMELGVSAAVINKAYKTGKPSVRRTFHRLPEEV